MAQGSKGKKAAVTLPQKKDDANAAHKALIKQAEESNSTMAGMVAKKGKELREYMSRKKRQMKAKVKMFLEKDKSKKKRKKKKKGAPMNPILGSVLKFHKDDDVDPTAAGATA
ncbi:hypothetical protein ACP70R_022515 [Stipagrostis hirtigluma subsp. patula]